MNQTIGQLFEIFKDVWATGNRWIRWAVGFIVLWPLALVVIALLSGDPRDLADQSGFWNFSQPNIILALLPAAAAFCVFMLWFDPMLLVAIGIPDGGRALLRWLALMIGMQEAIGLYLVIVPIKTDPGLVLLLLLAVATLLFLGMGLGMRLAGFARFVFGLVSIGAVLLTLVFLLGGRSGVATKWNAVSKTAAAAPAVSRASTPAPPPPLTIRADREGFVEVPRGTPMVTVPVSPDRWSSWLVLEGRCETNITYEDDSKKPELKVWGRKGVRILPPDRSDEGVSDDVQKLCFRGPAQVVKIYFNWR